MMFYLYLGYWACAPIIKPGITSRPLGHRKIDHSHPIPGFKYWSAYKIDCSKTMIIKIEQQVLIRTKQYIMDGFPLHEVRIGANSELIDIDKVIQCAIAEEGFNIAPCYDYDLLNLQDVKDEIPLNFEPFASSNSLEVLEEELQLVEVLEEELQLVELQVQIIPNAQQKDVLDGIEDFYKINNIGKLIWACGLGKALLSILIAEKLQFKSVVIGVSSIALQIQLLKELLKIFPNEKQILLIGGDKIKNILSTNRPNKIKEFLNSPKTANEPKFIITTYHSCHMLADVAKFDFKIGDEAHHLAGYESIENGFRAFHRIKSSKTLFMTATEKIIDNSLSVDYKQVHELVHEQVHGQAEENKVGEMKFKEKTYSMDDASVFGKVIDMKTVHWAIENKKITDYNVILLKNTMSEIDAIIDNLKIENVKNKEIFMSCYMCLKSFEHYSDLTHLLIYANTTDSAELAAAYIDKLMNLSIITIPKEKLYNKALHSKNCPDVNSEVSVFKKSPWGIISCVFMFGEGFDMPKLNGVCIAETMKSETRIVQYSLRPNRLEKGNPDKQAYIIIPYTEGESLINIKCIIGQMRNVDSSIEQKIKLLTCNGGSKIPTKDKNYHMAVGFEENLAELNKIKMALRHSKLLNSDFSEEQREYDYVRAINISLNIKSKKEYIQSQAEHENYIEQPEDYFKKKGVWESWYDFMGTDTSEYIKTKADWIQECKRCNVKSINDYYNICETNVYLPREPADFYREFTNIPNELGLNKGRRR